MELSGAKFNKYLLFMWRKKCIWMKHNLPFNMSNYQFIDYHNDKSYISISEACLSCYFHCSFFDILVNFSKFLTDKWTFYKKIIFRDIYQCIYHVRKSFIMQIPSHPSDYN